LLELARPILLGTSYSAEHYRGVDADNGAQLEHFPNPVSAQLMPLRLNDLQAKSLIGAGGA
jgi:hypothetical protein